MLEAIKFSFEKTNAARIQQLRERRHELMRQMKALNNNIDDINVEIRDLMGNLTQRACDRVDKMTVEQAETIVAAMNSHRDFPRFDADYVDMDWDGLS